ncbi:MAG: serine hydrolase domain-containing protein [Planctomycetota bacterium]
MSFNVNRRVAIQQILAGAGTLAGGIHSGGNSVAEDSGQVIATGDAKPHLAPFDTMMRDFVKTQRVPGASLAVSRNSLVVYARGFGLADREVSRPVQPDSLFRLASISKPLTAVAVMQLVEQGKFGLDDRIFDLLPAKDWLPKQHDERLRIVTVRHLLQHTAGWDRTKSFDPIGRVHDIARDANKPLPVDVSDVIRYTLTLPLDFDPGTRYAYYNVDYLLLGRLIELMTREKYEHRVKQHVLAPMGITRMELGRAWKEDLARDEVRYYDSKQREPVAVCGSKLGSKVSQVYGGENFEAYEAHGGWIGSAVDLVRFISAFDHVHHPKLLKAETLHTMWSRPSGLAGHEADGKPNEAYYACGWNVRPVGVKGGVNAWHSGLIAGTSTLLVRRHDGMNWAVLFNTESNPEGKSLSGLIDPLVHQAADAFTNWP